MSLLGPRQQRRRPRYIAVEGPIGAGKTSLAEILSAQLGARLVCENPGENPFLGSFYRDPKRFALSTQLFFLLARYGQQAEFLQGGLFEQGGVVSDYLFAKDRLFATLTLSPDELALYDRVYQSLRPRVAAPDLVVYLQARTDVLLARIDKRGRVEEKTIRSDYVRDVARARTPNSSSTTPRGPCSSWMPRRSISSATPRIVRRSWRSSTRPTPGSTTGAGAEPEANRQAARTW
jgi:deoxyadenosine/deoxycytidine kinase